MEVKAFIKAMAYPESIDIVEIFSTTDLRLVETIDMSEFEDRYSDKSFDQFHIYENNDALVILEIHVK